MGVKVGLLLLLSGCGGSKQAADNKPSTRPPPLVSAATSKIGRLTEYVTVSGKVRTLRRANVNTHITGRVVRVDVREGDAVRAGQPLLWLDDQDQRAQVAQAAANVAAARARVTQLEHSVQLTNTDVATGIGRADQSVLQTKAARLRDQAEYDNARVDLDRKASLVSSGSITRAEYDTARMRFEQAREQLKADDALVNAANQSLRLAHANTAQRPMLGDQVRGARAAVDQAEAALQGARVNLGYTVLYAPISGTIASRAVDPGQAVSPQQSGALLSVVDNRHLELAAPVNEGYAATLRPHAEVDVSAPSRPDSTLRGHVFKVAPSADTTSHTVLVRVAVSDPQARLLDGMYVTARLRVKTWHGVQVPLSAVQTREDESWVMVLQGDRVTKRAVNVAYQDGGEAIIRKGLAAGARVIAVGAEGLVDGQTVRVAPAAGG